jgi:hypothetical protein
LRGRRGGGDDGRRRAAACGGCSWLASRREERRRREKSAALGGIRREHRRAGAGTERVRERVAGRHTGWAGAGSGQPTAQRGATGRGLYRRREIYNTCNNNYIRLLCLSILNNATFSFQMPHFRSKLSLHKQNKDM